jgi:ABC-type long-subunit fatty acid transport system fused permease/ATPase subunit
MGRNCPNCQPKLREIYYVVAYDFAGDEIKSPLKYVFNSFPTPIELQNVIKKLGAFEVKIDKRYRIE